MNIRAGIGFGSLMAIFVIACGSTSTPAGGESSGSGASANTVDCDALLKEINDLRPQVQQCCAACAVVQCTKFIDDICCPITANGGPIDQFEADVKEYNASCPHICPAIACQSGPSGVCDLSGSCKQN